MKKVFIISDNFFTLYFKFIWIVDPTIHQAYSSSHTIDSLSELQIHYDLLIILLLLSVLFLNNHKIL